MGVELEQWFKKYQVDVPEGKSGPWKVEKFKVKGTEIQAMRLASEGRGLSPGIYTRLKHEKSWDPMMSDTPAEIRDHLEIIRKAHGRVLLNGLGLGVVLKAILNKPEVTHVDVVEINQDIINLVWPTYKDNPKITLHHADAFTIQWPKGTRWNVAWHDIWPNICVDNLEEMAKLHRKYGRRVDWQDSWSKSLCRYYRRRDR